MKRRRKNYAASSSDLSDCSSRLLIGNNVLAQVPDLNDFVEGMAILLKPDGVLTMEFPHLLCLMRENQFDTIYHEHFSYFSLLAIDRIFGRHGLAVFDVETLSTHGGSLRVYAKHAGDATKPCLPSADALRQAESDAGLDRMETYAGFAEQVRETKRRLLEFLITARRDGKQVLGYGAPGKGNTLLNYCGIRADFLDYTVDRNPYKQGRYLPGTHIPIFAPDRIRETKPKPMVPVGNRPIILHLMKFYAHYGHKEFVLCRATRATASKSFFSITTSLHFLKNHVALGV